MTSRLPGLNIAIVNSLGINQETQGQAIERVRAEKHKKEFYTLTAKARYPVIFANNLVRVDTIRKPPKLVKSLSLTVVTFNKNGRWLSGKPIGYDWHKNHDKDHTYFQFEQGLDQTFSPEDLEPARHVIAEYHERVNQRKRFVILGPTLLGITEPCHGLSEQKFQGLPAKLAKEALDFFQQACQGYFYPRIVYDELGISG